MLLHSLDNEKTVNNLQTASFLIKMMNSAVSLTTAGPSEDQWKNHQAMITQLYQSKPLREVMKVLERDSGFKASEKMYKSRIHKWQIDKKRKRHEMLFAKKVIEERRQEGKSTQITIRGQDIAEADVHKYFKRLKTSATSDATDAENAPTPPELSYGTPVLQSIPLIHPLGQQVGIEVENETTYHATNTTFNNLETFYPAISTSETCGLSMNGTNSVWPVYTVQPELRAIRSDSAIPWAAQSNDNNLEALWGTSANDVVSSSTDGRYSWQSSFLGTYPGPFVPATCIYESILHNIYAYLNLYYFKSDKWIPHKDKILGQPDLRSAVEENGIVLKNPGFLTDLVFDALQLFKLGLSDRAVSLIDSACAMIQMLAKEQHPQLLSKLLVAVSYQSGAKYNELIQAVLLHFYDMADIMLGPRHPLTQLSSWLAKASAQSVDVSPMGLRVLRDGYIQHAGHDHPESLMVMVDEASEMSSRGKPIEAEIILGNLLQLYDSRLGPLTLESRMIMTRQVFIHIQRGDLASARYVLEEQYRRLIQLKEAYEINVEKVYNLRLRASMCKLRNEYAEMQVLVTKAWKMATASLPADDVEMLVLAHNFPAAERHIAQNAE